jgi:hypothetical protein
MRLLSGKVPENTAGIKGGGRQLVVSKALQWNSGRESQMIKWKEAESKRMGYENLQWRRKLISDAVAKTTENLDMDLPDRVKGFGASSTVFLTTSASSRGLERTVSHTSTKVSTGAKVAVRKIRGGRVRGMKVLAHMNTVRWHNMSTADREEAIQCPCQGGIQNVEHMMTGACDYTLTHLDEMIDTVSSALRSEPETVQVKWAEARNIEEKVAAIVGTDMRKISPDAVCEVAASLKLLVRRSEKALRAMNKAGESWPMDNLVVWAPSNEELQMELQSDVLSSDTQQAAAA